MREETKSIGFACALGAFIGALLVFECRARFQYGMYLWPIGALFGGSIAYVAMDFREFCSGVARAYRAMIAWEPHVPFWKAYGAMFLCRLSIVFSVLLLVCSLILVASIGIQGLPKDFFGDVFMLFICSCIEVAFLITTLTPFSLMRPLKRQKEWIGRHEYRYELESEYEDRLLKIRTQRLCVAFVATPIGIIFIFGTLVFETFVWMIENIDGYRSAKQCVVQIFINVHSDRRAICLVDSVIGAIAGFFYGSALFGAMVGAVLGMVNYELIAVRWLKIVPVRVE